MSLVRRNRIVRRADVPPQDLLNHPDNILIHTAEQEAQMAHLLTTVGWVARVLVSARSGRIIDGHMRVNVALQKGIATVPVAYLDLTEEEERKAILYLKRTTGLARIDPVNLEQVLESLTSDDATIEAMRAAFAQEAGVLAKQAREQPRQVVEHISVQIGDFRFTVPWAAYVHWRGQLQFLYRTRHDTINWVILVRLGLRQSEKPV